MAYLSRSLCSSGSRTGTACLLCTELSGAWAAWRLTGSERGSAAGCPLGARWVPAEAAVLSEGEGRPGLLHSDTAAFRERVFQETQANPQGFFLPGFRRPRASLPLVQQAAEASLEAKGAQLDPAGWARCPKALRRHREAGVRCRGGMGWFPGAALTVPQSWQTTERKSFTVWSQKSKIGITGPKSRCQQGSAPARALGENPLRAPPATGGCEHSSVWPGLTSPSAPPLYLRSFSVRSVRSLPRDMPLH